MNGGAGRVIASIPAFELYEKENPKDVEELAQRTRGPV